VSQTAAEWTHGQAEILCVEEGRMVGRDNTVAYAGLRLQLPASPARAHYVKARVKVRAYADGESAIFHGPASSGPLRP
jgi:hypothetical protein